MPTKPEPHHYTVVKWHSPENSVIVLHHIENATSEGESYGAAFRWALSHLPKNFPRTIHYLGQRPDAVQPPKPEPDPPLVEYDYGGEA